MAVDVTEEDYFMQQQAEEYERYMSWIIHTDYLVQEQKWTFVKLDYYHDTALLQEWMEKNIKGNWDANWATNEFVFEKGADATWTRLVWKSE